ncbi:MAG TPA: orotidine-5'-phosphate decarboxylase [Phycisphaerales bacterium]|nr:orotidine-5'-phosphate decarboxylase [Phycisphaerales bacterium]
MSDAPSARFSDRLADAIDRVGAPVCVGLDPVADRLPAEFRARPGSDDEAVGLFEFCVGVVEAVRGHAAAVKPQSACFERYGAAGLLVLRNVIGAARSAGLIVVLDAKRGDIGTTAEHYAAAAVGLGADAVTVSGYLGPETVKPFLEAGLGVFVLVRTSNPGSDAVQSARLEDGRTVAEMMADHVAALGAGRRGARGLSDAGAVVGATKPADGAALRARMPDVPILVPGYGAQGGTADDVRALVRDGARTPGERGVLVNASRSVIYAAPREREGWQAAVGRAAREMAEDLRRALG